MKHSKKKHNDGGFKGPEPIVMAVGCVGCKFAPMCPKTYGCADLISKAEALAGEKKERKAYQEDCYR